MELIQRDFVIGEEWLYYKIYLGKGTSDSFLKQYLYPYVQSLKEQNIITKWFFIRYADPEPHLRIRFYNNDPQKLSFIIFSFKNILKELLDQDIIWKVQVDTYDRELNRYGGGNIINMESLFEIDSELLIKFLAVQDQYNNTDLRWIYGLKSIDSILSAFRYDLKAKLNLLIHLKNSFAREFGMNRFLKKQLDSKYRIYTSAISNFMEENEPEKYDCLYKLIAKRNELSKSYADKILKLKQNNKLEVSINDLLASYVHMFMNRLFTSKNRMNEMVCYDFLFRFYKSKTARQKYN